MGNMSYCRFQNTAPDLKDCVDAWDDDLSLDELRAKRRVLRLAVEIFEMSGIDFDMDHYGYAVEALNAEIEGKQ